MKIFLLFSIITISSIAFSQQDQGSMMFWNQYALVNPATSGLEFKHDFKATYNRSNSSLSFNPSNFSANYNTRFLQKNGVGTSLESFVWDTLMICHTKTLH